MPALTKAQIIQAAKTLRNNGQEPSTIKVRKALGRGSYTTIGAALKEWRESHSRKAHQATKETQLQLPIEQAQYMPKNSFKKPVNGLLF